MKKQMVLLLMTICMFVLFLTGCASSDEELSYKEVYNNYIEKQTEETWYAWAQVCGFDEPLLFVADQCAEIYDENDRRYFSTYEAAVYMRDGNNVKKIHEFRLTEEAGVGGGFLAVEQTGYLIEKRNDHKIVIWKVDAAKRKLVTEEQYNEDSTNSELQTGHDRCGAAAEIRFSYFKPGQLL